MPKHKHEFFPTWNSMMQRCSDKNSRSYLRYGGRGIYVCDEWKDFYQFEKWAYATIGHKTKEYTLDRIDNDGPYAPWNCRWATMKEQHRNKSDTRKVVLNGEEKSVIELCEIYNLNYTTVKERLNRGWSAEEAFNTRPRELVHKQKGKFPERFFIIDGVKKNMTDWSRHYSISPLTVSGRLSRGWSIERALTEPVNAKCRHKKLDDSKEKI